MPDGKTAGTDIDFYTYTHGGSCGMRPDGVRVFSHIMTFMVLHTGTYRLLAIENIIL